jgi:hypothetical protein
MTYAELITKLRDYTEVDSSVLTSTILDGIIRDVEFRIFREVDGDYARKYETSLSTGANRYIALPADCFIIRSLQLISKTGDASFERAMLEKKDTSFISEFYPSTTTSGTPKYYANWDPETVVIAPTPDVVYGVQLNYIFTPEALTSANTTTTLSTRDPDLLLYGCLINCYAYLKGPMDMYKLYEGKYNEAIQTYALQQMGRRRRDDYDFGVPRIKVPSPSP